MNPNFVSPPPFQTPGTFPNPDDHVVGQLSPDLVCAKTPSALLFLIPLQPNNPWLFPFFPPFLFPIPIFPLSNPCVSFRLGWSKMANRVLCLPPPPLFLNPTSPKPICVCVSVVYGESLCNDLYWMLKMIQNTHIQILHSFYQTRESERDKWNYIQTIFVWLIIS